MKFPNLPAATTLTGVEIVPLTQGGVDRRTTTQEIANLTQASLIPFSNSAFTADNVEDAIVEAAGGGGVGGTVDSVVAGHGTDVDDTDPANPVVAVDETELDAGLIPFSSSAFTATNIEDAIAEAAAGAGGGAVSSVNGDTGAVIVAAPICIACSDETTALTTGTAKVTFRMPYAFTLTGVRASVSTAPTGSVLTVDINEGGSTILSTKITIDATEKTSTTAATPPVISDSALADDAEITIDIDTVGSTIAGAGLKVWLIGYAS